MDPHQQQLNQLDPKLKEAYERVMGIGKIPPSPPANPPVSPQSPLGQGAADTSAERVRTPLPISPIPIPPVTPASTPPNQTPATGWTSPVPPPAAAMPPVMPGKNAFGEHGFVAKKKSTVSPVIIVLGVIVFLTVYTIFWIKFFNIKVPFLP